MRLYDDVIASTLSSLEGRSIKKLPVKKESIWPDEGRAMMILRSDMAYELGGGTLPAVGNTLLTTDERFVNDDEIILLGKDLGDIKKDTPYGRIAIVRVKEDSIGTGNKLYNTIQSIGYFRYHIYPSGFMLRVSSSTERESVRVAKDALEKGLDFTAVGNAMITALHKHKEVEKVKIIFITDEEFDYDKLKEGLKKTKEITAAIDHMLKDVNMDCTSCGLQEICDEVEELREMHFKMGE